tara:strand:- start:324 stop:665 length:342 start_codon:yes stop_codon:yes gene_type:complete
MDNQTKHKIEGQEYSNNCIETMQDILDIQDDEERYEAIANYGLSIDKQKVINYLITWGSPAYRLQIIFDEDNRIVSVEPQYQDWFTEWQTVPTTSKQRETLINFAHSLHLEEF